MIDDQLYLFGILYFSNIFKYTDFLVPHDPFQKHLYCEEVQIHKQESRHIYYEMNMANYLWNIQD